MACVDMLTWPELTLLTLPAWNRSRSALLPWRLIAIMKHFIFAESGGNVMNRRLTTVLRGSVFGRMARSAHETVEPRADLPRSGRDGGTSGLSISLTRFWFPARRDLGGGDRIVAKRSGVRLPRFRNPERVLFKILICWDSTDRLGKDCPCSHGSGCRRTRLDDGLRGLEQPFWFSSESLDYSSHAARCSVDE